MQREDMELPSAGSLNPPAFAEDSRHFIRHHLNRVQTVDRDSCGATLRTMRNFRSSSKADIAPANREMLLPMENRSLPTAKSPRSVPADSPATSGNIYFVERLFRLMGAAGTRVLPRLHGVARKSSIQEERRRVIASLRQDARVPETISWPGSGTISWPSDSVTWPMPCLMVRPCSGDLSAGIPYLLPVAGRVAGQNARSAVPMTFRGRARSETQGTSTSPQMAATLL